MTTTTTQNGFERETCSRCGGTGHYSHCEMYGTTCFKCRGRREVLSKRGEVARQYLVSLRSRRLDSLKVGDKIKADFMGSITTYTVEAITADTSDSKSYINGILQPRRTDLLSLDLSDSKDGLTLLGQRPETTFQMVLTKEEQQATLNAALAYQATLTKQGKPRK